MDDRTERAVDAAYAAIDNVHDLDVTLDDYARAAALAVLAEIDAECAAERDALRAENATLMAEAAVMGADRERMREALRALITSQEGDT